MEANARNIGGSQELLTDRLFMQVPAGDAGEVLDLIDPHGSGIILTGERATALSHLYWRDALQAPLLIDRRRYAGNRRHLGTDTFDHAWLDAQRMLQVASVLTDSGYVGESDESSLRSILEQAVEAGEDVTAVLPLHLSWLLTPRLDTLIGEISAHDVPVALVLEHRRDPLAGAPAVAGLKTLLERATVPVSLLSTDISGLGAIAFGAHWAAVGTTSALRHLYPRDSGGGPMTRSRHAFVMPLLAFLTLGKVLEGVRSTRDNAELTRDVWTCACTTCGSRCMDWLAYASDAQLSAHTFEPLLELREAIASLAPNQRRASWVSKCVGAIYRHQELRAQRGLTWEIPPYLRAWTSS